MSAQIMLREPRLNGCQLRITLGTCSHSSSVRTNRWFPATVGPVTVSECKQRHRAWQRTCGRTVRVDVKLPTAALARRVNREGYGEAARAVCAWLYYAPACRMNASACIERKLAVVARSRSLSVSRLHEVTLRRCMRDHVLGQRPPARLPLEGIAPIQESLWLVAIIRMQMRHLVYWLTWHLSLGVTHVVIFDNHAGHEKQARSALAAAVAPFGSRVELIHWPGDGKQSAAYERAMEMAKVAKVAYVAALDVDELAVPFVDGSLGPLLAACSRSPHCGGLSLNWRLTRRAHGLSANPASTMLNAVSFDTGELHPFVKTIARVSAHAPGSFIVHNNKPARPFCLFGEDMRRVSRGCTPSWARDPPSGTRAVILHMHCASLVDWVFRRSMRGRSDFAVSRDTCPVCGASLADIAQEYDQTCTRAPTRGLTRFSVLPSAAQTAEGAARLGNMTAIAEFLSRMDVHIGALLLNHEG